MWSARSDEDDGTTTPDVGGRTLSKWNTHVGLHHRSPPPPPPPARHSLGVSDARKRTTTKVTTAAHSEQLQDRGRGGDDTGGVCVLVAARVPQGQAGGRRRRHVSPGRNFSSPRHFSPGRTLGTADRHVSPGRTLGTADRHASPGRDRAQQRDASGPEVIFTGRLTAARDRDSHSSSHSHSHSHSHKPHRTLTRTEVVCTGPPAIVCGETDRTLLGRGRSFSCPEPDLSRPERGDSQGAAVAAASSLRSGKGNRVQEPGLGSSEWTGCNGDAAGGEGVAGKEEGEEEEGLTPSHNNYLALAKEWTLYASQLELDCAGLTTTATSTTTTSSSSSSQPFSHADVITTPATPPPPSSSSSSFPSGARSRLSSKCDSEDSIASSDVFEPSTQRDRRHSSAAPRGRAQSDAHHHHQLQLDSDGVDSDSNNNHGLVSSLRRPRSKSECGRADKEVDKASKPGKSVHFSIFPYVREIPARQKTSSLGASRAVSSLTAPERSGRTRSRIGVSQSQPGSRSTSPSSRGSYLTHTHHGASREPPPSKSKRKSGIPRSQGASREASPNRLAYGRERRLSGSKIPQPGVGVISGRTLRPGSDVEDALHDALQRPIRKRYEMYDSDDAASETSSVCSERSYNSYSGRTSEDMQEIVALLGSGSYTDRKEGLISLKLLLRSNKYLTRVELKKVTEVFTRMFHDPHSKVFSIFLDTLSDLCMNHSPDLIDWLYVLLTRLLNKTSADLLGSVNAKLLHTLDTVRETFPGDSQFNVITKFIIDQTQSPSFKVKIAMLNYLLSLITIMEPSDFVNSMDTRLAVSRIINWTIEPRNVETRKIAQLVLIALFNLNPPEFSLMLAALPKAFQDGATKILQTHMRTASESTSDVLSPRNATSPPLGQQRSRPPSRQSQGQPEDFETENMNPQDIYNSIKKTSADIQNLSLGTKLDGYDDIKKKREFASQDSGIQEIRNDSPDGVESRRGNLHTYNPHQYQDEQSAVNGFGKAALAEDKTAAPATKEMTIPDVLRELSNHNERFRERRNTLDMLCSWVRHNAISEEQWDEHFKSILLILIETFGDSDKSVRMYALIVFRSILKRQAPRFRDYAELTILKICEAHKDPSKDVQRAAEECALVIPTAINPEQALSILNNIIQTAKFPMHWAAIKMQVEVVKLVTKEVMLRSLPSTVPGLIMGYDDSDSRVRKAAVFCLVNIYAQVGDTLRPYLTDLNSSKTKLLNLYIKRAEEDAHSGSGIMSPTISDT